MSIDVLPKLRAFCFEVINGIPKYVGDYKTRVGYNEYMDEVDANHVSIVGYDKVTGCSVNEIADTIAELGHTVMMVMVKDCPRPVPVADLDLSDMLQTYQYYVKWSEIKHINKAQYRMFINNVTDLVRRVHMDSANIDIHSN